MPNDRESLLAGRATRPLDKHDVVRVTNTFLGLDREASVQHDPAGRTRCRVYEEGGEIICDIMFGPDIYPGTGSADPNSILSMRAAAAHELSHFHRWKDKTELDGAHLTHIDEALTSLGAIQRFHSQLNETEVRQLVADAIQRLQLFAQKHEESFVIE